MNLWKLKTFKKLKINKYNDYFMLNNHLKCICIYL